MIDAFYTPTIISSYYRFSITVSSEGIIRQQRFYLFIVVYLAVENDHVSAGMICKRLVSRIGQVYYRQTAMPKRNFSFNECIICVRPTMGHGAGHALNSFFI